MLLNYHGGSLKINPSFIANYDSKLMRRIKDGRIFWQFASHIMTRTHLGFGEKIGAPSVANLSKS